MTILSDDRDMLSSANLVFSFLGIEINFRSVFEVLRASKASIGTQKVFLSNSLGVEILNTKIPSKDNLLQTLEGLAKKGQVGFHPSYSNRDVNIKKLLRNQ